MNNPEAYKMTLEDLKQFQQNMQLLLNPKIDESEKRQIATSMKQMQRILKKVQGDADATDFSVFYAYHIGGQTVRNLSAQYGINEGTIRRARTRVVNKIAVLLYPDIIFAGIFD